MKLKSDLKQVCMKILIKFRNSLNSSIFIYILYIFLKLLPLILLTHEWKVIKEGNMKFISYLFLSTYLVDNKTLTNIFLALSLLLTIVPGIILLSLLAKIKEKKFFRKLFAIILNLSYYFSFFLVQYSYEIFTCFGLQEQCENSICQINYGLYLPFSLIFILLLIFMNTLMVLIIYKPHFILPYNYIGFIDSIGIKWVVLAILQSIAALEHFIPFTYMLYLKIFIRFSFMIYYFYFVYNNSLIREEFELFILSFCFFSCIFEFGVLHLFINIDIDVLNSAPLSVTNLYDTKVFLLKLAIQVMLSVIIILFMRNRRYRNDIGLFNFTRGGKKSTYFCYFNLIYSSLYFLKNQSSNQKDETEILKFYNQVIDHHVGCVFEDCFCRQLVLKYYKIMDSNETKPKLQKLFKLVINELENLVHTNIQKVKDSDPFDTFQLLLIDVLYNLYFKKHFVKSFFNIQQIENLSVYRRSRLIQLQIHFLKYEVIFGFIKHYEQTDNRQYKVMNLNYKKCAFNWKIEASIVNCLISYKSIVQKFFEKTIKYEDFHKSLTQFYTEFSKNEKLIEKGLSRQFDENMNISLKFLYFNNFFNNKKFLELKDLYLKNPKSILSNLNNKSQLENMIIRHTKNREFIIEYLSPNFSQYIGYSTNDILGKELHEIMPTGFKEVHYNHVKNHIANNKMTLTDKEVFFLDSSGYMVMFNISGSVLLTLEEEFYIYTQLQCLTDYFTDNNVASLCCDDRGFIRHIDIRFENVFVYKNALINMIPINFFTEILERSKQDIEKKLENGAYTISLTYEQVIQKFAMIDYDKLWDYDNLGHIQFTDEFKFDKLKYATGTKIDIVIEKRSLTDTTSVPKQQLFFYVVKLLLKGGQYSSLIQNDYTELIHSLIKTAVLEDNLYVRNIFPKMKYYSLLALDKCDETLCIKHDEIKSLSYETVLGELRKKKYKAIYKNYNININIILLLIALACFTGVYYYLNTYKNSIIDQTLDLLYLDENLFNLGNYLYLASSISIQIFLNKNRNNSDSNSYNITQYNTYIDEISRFYLNSEKTFEKYYYKLDGYILDNVKYIFTDDINVKYLDLDWVLKSEARTLEQVIKQLFIKFRRMDNEGSNIDISYYPAKKAEYFGIPNYLDQNIVFIIENIIPTISEKLDSLFEHSSTVINSYIGYGKFLHTIITSILSLVLICFIVYQIYIYKKIQYVLFVRYFTTHNIIKFHHFYLFKKLQIFEEFMKDFTVDNFRKSKNINLLDYTAKNLSPELYTKTLTNHNDTVNTLQTSFNNTLGLPAGKIKSSKILSISFLNNILKGKKKEKITPQPTLQGNKDTSVNGVNTTINKTLAPMLGNNTSNLTINKKDSDDKNEFIINKNQFQTSTKISKYFITSLVIIFVLISTCILLILKAASGYNLIYNNYYFMQAITTQNLYLRKLILIYQINFIKNIELKDSENNNLFFKYNDEYLQKQLLVTNITNSNNFGFESFIEVKASMETSEMCSIIANLTTVANLDEKFVPTCLAMGNGVNEKGYSIMVNQIYHLIFFLHNDLIYKLQNRIKYDFEDIFKDQNYRDIIEDSFYILLDIDEIYTKLLSEYNIDSVGRSSDIQNASLFLLLGEIWIIFVTFLVFFKYSYSKSRELIIKIEQVIANTISCKL
jgi:PAS domain S-box-containing protein